MTSRGITWSAAVVVPIAALLYFFYHSKSSSLSPTVWDAPSNVTYVGTLFDKIEHYQNIFYAESTAGRNRFAPPIAHIPPPGAVIDASSPGAWCPQGIGDAPLPFTSAITNISENCLSLRIARLQGTAKDARLPVVLWMHGGGHALGSASDTLYAPDGMLQQASLDHQPIIFVGINYRLGMFGFAANDALRKIKHTNAGLRDQRAAMEWVRKHISAFGGDPARITVIGQSVGASDIGLHLLSYAGQQGVPFQRAIMMSGSPGLTFNLQTDEVKDRTTAIASQVGCAAHDTRPEQTLECLRNVPMEKLVNVSVAASRAARPPFGEAYFYPTVDGDYIPNRPSVLLRSGAFVKDVPLIVSWVANEGAWYASPTTSTDEEVAGSFGLWLQSLSPSTIAELLRLYPLSDFEHLVRPEYDGPISTQYYRAAQLNRDLWFTCPSLDFAWRYASSGKQGLANVRLYEHNATRFTSYFEMMGVPMWRVAHLSDIPYVLNSQLATGADNSAQQIELSRRLSGSAVRFANTGDPAGSVKESVDWPLAFHGVAEKDWKQDTPSKISLYLFGGPHGSGPVTINEKGISNDASEREKAVADEKLFERCAFINSHAVQAEIGV